MCNKMNLPLATWSTAWSDIGATHPQSTLHFSHSFTSFKLFWLLINMLFHSSNHSGFSLSIMGLSYIARYKFGLSWITPPPFHPQFCNKMPDHPSFRIYLLCWAFRLQIRGVTSRITHCFDYFGFKLVETKLF